MADFSSRDLWVWAYIRRVYERAGPWRCPILNTRGVNVCRSRQRRFAFLILLGRTAVFREQQPWGSAAKDVLMTKHRATTEEEPGNILAAMADLNAQAAAVSARLHADVAALALLQRQMAELVVRLCTTPQHPCTGAAIDSRPDAANSRCGATCWSRSIYRLAHGAREDLPAPRRLGPRAVAWIEGDIANWVLNRPPL